MESSNATSTSLEDQEVDSQKFGLAILTKLLPIAIAITLTNGLVFVLFCKKRSLCNSSNYLLLSLSVCDFLTGTVSIPYFIIFSFPDIMQFGDFATDLMFVIHNFLAISSGYHILVITGEKYLAISKPIRHHLLRKSTIWKVSLGVWVISAGFALVPFAWWKLPFPIIQEVVYSASCLFMIFVVPYAFMIYSYIIMFKAISKRKMPRQQNDVQKTRFQKTKRDDKKCILVFATMAAIYALCWMPYFIVMLIIHLSPFYLILDEKSDMALDQAAELFAIIRFMTSVVNPLLYTYFKRDFWRALKALLRAKGLKIPSISGTITTRSLMLSDSSSNVRQSIFSEEKVTLSAFDNVNPVSSDILEDGNISTTTV